MSLSFRTPSNRRVSVSPTGTSPEGQDGQPDTRPFLCIPYWTAPIAAGGSWDSGHDRPLPESVVSYACAAVHVGPYVPGEPLEVSVDVHNSGGGNSDQIATVAV